MAPAFPELLLLKTVNAVIQLLVPKSHRNMLYHKAYYNQLNKAPEQGPQLLNRINEINVGLSGNGHLPHVMIGGQTEEVAVRYILGDYESPFFSMDLFHAFF